MWNNRSRWNNNSNHNDNQNILDELFNLEKDAVTPTETNRHQEHMKKKSVFGFQLFF